MDFCWCALSLVKDVTDVNGILLMAIAFPIIYWPFLSQPGFSWCWANKSSCLIFCQCNATILFSPTCFFPSQHIYSHHMLKDDRRLRILKTATTARKNLSGNFKIVRTKSTKYCIHTLVMSEHSLNIGEEDAISPYYLLTRLLLLGCEILPCKGSRSIPRGHKIHIEISRHHLYHCCGLITVINVLPISRMQSSTTSVVGKQHLIDSWLILYTISYNFINVWMRLRHLK